MQSDYCYGGSPYKNCTGGLQIGQIDMNTRIGSGYWYDTINDTWANGYEPKGSQQYPYVFDNNMVSIIPEFNIYDAVQNYAEILSNNYPGLKARLMSYEEATSILGCSEDSNCLIVLGEGNYYLGSASKEGFFNVERTYNGFRLIVGDPYWGEMHIRPVIEITKSDLD